MGEFWAGGSFSWKPGAILQMYHEKANRDSVQSLNTHTHTHCLRMVMILKPDIQKQAIHTTHTTYDSMLPQVIAKCYISSRDTVGSPDGGSCFYTITPVPEYWVSVSLIIHPVPHWLKSWGIIWGYLSSADQPIPDSLPESQTNDFNPRHKLIWLTGAWFITCLTNSGAGSSITFDAVCQLLN